MALERDMMYFVLLAIVMNVNGGEVSISIESDGYPSHFYNGATVNFTCTVHDIAGITDLKAVGLFDGSDTAGCIYNPPGGWGPVVGLSQKLDLTPPAREHCQSTPTRSSVSIVGTVNEKMENVQLYCYVLDGSSVIESDEKVNVSSLRERPMNLIMSSPEIAKRNELITFNCTSEGAIPASQFNYKIRQNGQEVVSSSYTPPSDSTGNITLECEDRIHLNLTSNVREIRNIPLYYLELPDPSKIDRSTSLNPTNARLTCDVNGFPRPSYKWTCDDCTSGDNSRDWVLRKRRQNGETETITCTASVESLPSITITWEVTWSDDATTPPPTATPTPSTTTTEKPIPWPIIGGVIAGVVVLAAIAIGVFCWCKKKRSAPAGSKSANGDPEQMKMTNKSRGTEPGSNMPGKPKHQKSTKQKKAAETPNAPATSPRKYPNDTIIYAELDHGTRPPQTAVVKPNQQPPPPPQETVEYASIDIAKTRQYNQKGDGDAYMNVSKQKSQRSASPSQPLDRPPPPPSTH